MEWTTALGISMIVAGSAFLLIAGVSHLAAKKYRHPQPAPSPREIRINGPITIHTDRGSEELHCDDGWRVSVIQDVEPIERRTVRQESDTLFFNWPEPPSEVAASRSYSPSSGSYSDGGASYGSGGGYSSDSGGSSGGWD